MSARPRTSLTLYRNCLHYLSNRFMFYHSGSQSVVRGSEGLCVQFPRDPWIRLFNSDGEVDFCLVATVVDFFKLKVL
jgi:hypothetical protein